MIKQMELKMSVKKGFQVVNMRGTTCGHKHQSVEAAQKCSDKLMGFKKRKTKGSCCSAIWYNSKIVLVGEDYYHNTGSF
jgi:hypothetical protein